MMLDDSVSLVEFMYRVLMFARQVRYRKRLGPLLLCSFGVFRALINSVDSGELAKMHQITSKAPIHYLSNR